MRPVHIGNLEFRASGTPPSNYENRKITASIFFRASGLLPPRRRRTVLPVLGHAPQITLALGGLIGRHRHEVPMFDSKLVPKTYSDIFTKLTTCSCSANTSWTVMHHPHQNHCLTCRDRNEPHRVRT
jgi:hypothetical protein